MYPFRLFCFLCFLLYTIAVNAQDDCYTKVRQKGINQYNAKEYAAAIETWKAAKGCRPLPTNNDLDSWIKKANDKLNPPPKPVVKPATTKSQTTKPKPSGISAEDQKQREAAIRKEEAQKAEEAAWDFTKSIGIVSVYQKYLDKYPNGKYAATAHQKIKALLSTNVTNPIPTTQRLFYEPEMVEVSGGTFMMGCKDGRDTDCDNDEKPAHTVTVKDFQMGKYEVTQAQWRTVMGSDPPDLAFIGCDQCPVVNVSWNDIQDFIKKLNTKTNKNYRLPTEAEWEYAARGGNKSKNYQYAGSDKLDEVAWYRENAGSKNQPVGQKKANELGIYDMSGNVWEWVEDEWKYNYTGAPTNGSAWIEPINSSSSRVYRGGGNYPEDCRAANRSKSTPGLRFNFIGFRLAL